MRQRETERERGREGRGKGGEDKGERERQRFLLSGSTYYGKYIYRGKAPCLWYYVIQIVGFAFATPINHTYS